MNNEEEPFISRLSFSLSTAFRDVWVVWLTLAVLTTLPYVIAAVRTPAGYTFTGVLTAYDDTFTYFAWMRQSADGHLLMCDLFTSEPQSCEFFLPLWTILGFIARITHLPIAVTFHAARLLAGLLLLIAARSVVVSVIKSRRRVRYTLWLYAMSGGLGWLVFAVNNRCHLFGGVSTEGAIDLNLPEAFAFRSVFAQVHFAIGAALVFGSIRFLYRALIEKRLLKAFIAGILATLLSVVHPYMVVVVCSVVIASLFAYPVIFRPIPPLSDYSWRAKAAMIYVAGLLPGVVYLLYLNRSNEVLREWLRVTDTLSPSPFEYVLGFGIVAALAIPGFWLLWRHRPPAGRLLVIWAVLQAALLYAPASFQRRLVEGLQLPLCIAASAALFWISGAMFKVHARVYRRLILLGAIIFASLTNVGLIIGQIARGPVSGAADPRQYVSADLISTFDWLRAGADPDSVLFSSYLTGNLTPSQTGLRVFLGHYGQTIHSEEKGAEVASFYKGTLSEDDARRLFTENRIRYVIYGDLERQVYDVFKPPRWLRLAYERGNIQVFEVGDETK